MSDNEDIEVKFEDEEEKKEPILKEKKIKKPKKSTIRKVAINEVNEINKKCGGGKTTKAKKNKLHSDNIDYENILSRISNVENNTTQFMRILEQQKTEKLKRKEDKLKMKENQINSYNNTYQNAVDDKFMNRIFTIR